MTARISILINNYNYGRFLGAAITSALEQKPAAHEVVVVDDGSDDDSAAVIAGFAPRVRAVLKANGGQASAFNAGVAASTGDLLCLLDSDDVFLPGKLAAVAAAFASHAQAGWCFHPLEAVGPNLERDPGAPLPEWPYGACDLGPAARTARLPDLPTATSGMCFRRSLAQRIFPMPEARDVVLSDDFLKLRAVALEPGVVLGVRLALLRLHGGNRYSAGGAARARLAPLIAVNTALALRRLDPALAKLCDDMFRGGYRRLIAAHGRRVAAAEPAVAAYLAALPALGRALLTTRVAVAGLVRAREHDHV